MHVAETQNSEDSLPEKFSVRKACLEYCEDSLPEKFSVRKACLEYCEDSLPEKVFRKERVFGVL